MADGFEVEMRQPRELVAPSLLLLLAEAPGHGYDLMNRLKPLGFDWSGPGPVYRELRSLEAAGRVTSDWAVGTGPARRIYEITDAGRASLDRSVGGIASLQALAAEFLARAGQLRAPRTMPARAPRRAPLKTPAAAVPRTRQSPKVGEAATRRPAARR